MNNQVASRLFEGKSILCLGPEFVPAKAKGKVSRPVTIVGPLSLILFHQQNLTDPDANNGGASEAVPRIILTMGAARVEAALDIKAASSKPSAFDYVVTNQNVDAKTVTVEWVKDCLISRKLTSIEH